MFLRELNEVWESLRGQKPGREHFLEYVNIKGLRGIIDLKISFSYPVTVLAGPNECGKSTVLAALACAYYKPSAPKIPWYYPSQLFPSFTPKGEDLPKDISSTGVKISYGYVYKRQRYDMTWSKPKKGWGNSKNKLALDLYYRTLSNLTNPSEVRSVLQLYLKNLDLESIDPSSLTFAQSILRHNYSGISKVSENKGKNLLFANRQIENNNASYSEFHMSAGERSLLRLNIDLNNLENALVLIDEVEAGLHPYAQQHLMLELQRIALRQKLQIVLATHSPIILESVPAEGRIFLERETGGNVIVKPALRNIIQESFYTFTSDKLHLLCEDDISESLVRGILEFLIYKGLSIAQSDIEIGRDTGNTEYKAHIKALAKFNKLQDYIFILDGDSRSLTSELIEIGRKIGEPINVFCLPSNLSPEEWCWNIIITKSNIYADKFGISTNSLNNKLPEIDSLYKLASGKSSAIAKEKIRSLSIFLQLEEKEIIRRIGKEEAVSKNTDLKELIDGLEFNINQWQNFR